MPGVLIVEDDPLIRAVIMELLEDAGFIAFEATDAAEALCILNAHGENIRALVTDVRLPGDIDGVTLAKAAQEKWPWMRIIISSGSPEYAHQTMPENAAFLLKPWSPDTLLRLFAQSETVAALDHASPPPRHAFSPAA
jgi:DNA-binding NtrC family response regulator